MVLSSPNRADRFHPLLESIASIIRKHREDLTCLEPLKVDPALKSVFKSIDGDEIYINNELHSSIGIRKIHLEMAKMGKGLEILHCVFFPDPCYDLAIFGTDVVAGPGGISAAIVDVSPARTDLPVQLEDILKDFPHVDFKNVRKLPAWGSPIFSPYAHFIRPDDIEEEKLFASLVDNYLTAFLSCLYYISPDKKDSAVSIERNNGQISYCMHQKRNDKTRKLLSNVFSSEWADRYLEEVLFDSPLGF